MTTDESELNGVTLFDYISAKANLTSSGSMGFSYMALTKLSTDTKQSMCICTRDLNVSNAIQTYYTRE